MSGGRSPEATEYAVVAALQQAAIDAVVEQHSGEPHAQVVDALNHQFLVDGLAPPPGPWLDAVATEIATGRRFVVGNRLDEGNRFSNAAAGLPADADPDAEAARDTSLWFSHDPKIANEPPAEHASDGEYHPEANTWAPSVAPDNYG
jgi:hypothetical protein